MAVATQDATVRRRSRRKARLQENARAWAYILPAGLVMLVISVFPQMFQLWMSFTDFRVANLRFNIFDPETWDRFGPAWIGIENYVRIIESDLNIPNYNFSRLLFFTFVWAVVNVILHVSLGVGIAMVLNGERVIGRRFYRALFIIPWALPAYISALTWRNMFDPTFGAVNQLFGIDVDWLNDPIPPFDIPGLSWLPLAFYAVLIANTWLGWPFMMVVATGALQSIPKELYEAVDIDGATKWQKHWNVTFPLLRPAMVPAIMLGFIWTFNQFNVIFFISEGGPLGATEILVTQAYKLVAENQLYGVASAFAVVVFFILLVITLIQNRVTRATEAADA